MHEPPPLQLPQSSGSPQPSSGAPQVQPMSSHVRAPHTHASPSRRNGGVHANVHVPSLAQETEPLVGAVHGSPHPSRQPFDGSCGRSSTQPPPHACWPASHVAPPPS